MCLVERISTITKLKNPSNSDCNQEQCPTYLLTNFIKIFSSDDKINVLNQFSHFVLITI